MTRLEEECAVRMGAGPVHRVPVLVRREIAAGYRLEVEQLIARYGVSESIGDYVRHVVREGFEVDFDSMDPTDEALRTRGRAPADEAP